MDIDPIPSIVHFGWLIDLSKQIQLSQYTRDAWILFISVIVLTTPTWSSGQRTKNKYILRKEIILENQITLLLLIIHSDVLSRIIHFNLS